MGSVGLVRERGMLGPSKGLHSDLGEGLSTPCFMCGAVCLSLSVLSYLSDRQQTDRHSGRQREIVRERGIV